MYLKIADTSKWHSAPKVSQQLSAISNLKMNSFYFVLTFIAATAVANQLPCNGPGGPAPYIVRENNPSAKVSSTNGLPQYGYYNGQLSGWSSLPIEAFNGQLGAALYNGQLGLPISASLSRAIPEALSETLAPAPALAPLAAPCATPVNVVAPPLPNNINGKTIIHNPKPIVIRRPPTKIQINHPPIVVKPAPVAFHKPPAKVVRPVIVKNLPPSYQIEPVFKKIVGPVQKKVIVSNPPCGDAYGQY